MAEPDESERFLFDADALERCLAEGTTTHHDVIGNCDEGCLYITRSAREDFLQAFPDEEEIIEKNFQTFRRHTADNNLAAAFTDQLQNFTDVDERHVQEKIYLIATAYRGGLTIVTGEQLSPFTRMQVLADQLGVPCISVSEFMEKMLLD